MTLNPPDLRPDIAPKARLVEPARPGQPTIGMISLGCPKALVDSERILTRLRAEGYAISPDYQGADADLTLLDPERILDLSTYEKGDIPSRGIAHVLVGGTFVVRDSKPVEGVFPGKAIRSERPSSR